MQLKKIFSLFLFLILSSTMFCRQEPNTRDTVIEQRVSGASSLKLPRGYNPPSNPAYRVVVNVSGASKATFYY